jgi:two-component system, OmpR family, sensor histidine kinase KdpD
MDKIQWESSVGTIRSTEKKYGELTVFLGASSGVGKTYAMLNAACIKQKEGQDVLIGWLEEYDRYEKKERIKELSIMKPRLIQDEELHFFEMDVEEILNRHPQLVLIDELAHSNAPGSPRAKRYRDVEAILMAGIDVYTTLNIYEVESLKDIVSKIIGMEMDETVPDKFLERTSQIRLVDSPSDEIIRRFLEGKIRTISKNINARKFFRLGNIIALREMALRYAAGQVDQQLDEYMHSNKIPGPWPVSEKVMVCVSASPFSKQLIRMARQMSTSLKAEWIAVYVETPRRLPKSKQERLVLSSNLQFAEELGATVMTITGNSVAEEILELARNQNVKQIVIGKPRYSRIWEWMHGSVVNQVIRNSHEISVHIIPGKVESRHDKRHITVSRENLKWSPYFIITASIALLTILLRIFGLSFDLVNIALLYLFPVLFGSVRWGIGPSFYAAGVGVLAFDFFFVPPVYSFTVSDLRYVISFAVFLVVATLTASLASRLRHQLHEVRQREAITSTLYALSRNMTAVTDLSAALKSMVRQISETIGAQVAIYLPSETGELRLTEFSSGDLNWGQREPTMAIVKWVYRNGEIAGNGTQTLHDSPDLCFPLKTEDQIHGVLAVHLKNQDLAVTPDRIQLIEALTSLSAMAIARIKLQEEAKVAHLTAESERLRTALLDSISHELRTPLATIIGSVTAVIDGDAVFSSNDRHELLSTIREGAMRMNRLVTNLLGMVRIESGMLRLRKHWCDLEDIVGVALTQVKDSLQNRVIRLAIDESIPPIEVDDVLLEQVLVNVLSNAIKYSPDRSEIALLAKKNKNVIEIAIKDEGVGIPPHELGHIFSKFYRGESTRNIPGTGLGLAICKGIIEAHGGTIRATENSPKGTIITVSIPLFEPPLLQNENLQEEGVETS